MCSVQSGGEGGGGLSELLGGLDLNAEGGEDSLMQVMEGVMSTLLSKDVLYPSLSDLCSQVLGVSVYTVLSLITCPLS